MVLYTLNYGKNMSITPDRAIPSFMIQIRIRTIRSIVRPLEEASDKIE